MLGSNGREFKKVFAGAQKQLRATFGMEMVELPSRDRNLMTTEQKRKGRHLGFTIRTPYGHRSRWFS